MGITSDDRERVGHEVKKVLTTFQNCVRMSVGV